jgi:hypothetical protein
VQRRAVSAKVVMSLPARSVTVEATLGLTLQYAYRFCSRTAWGRRCAAAVAVLPMAKVTVPYWVFTLNGLPATYHVLVPPTSSTSWRACDSFGVVGLRLKRITNWSPAFTPQLLVHVSASQLCAPGPTAQLSPTSTPPVTLRTVKISESPAPIAPSSWADNARSVPPVGAKNTARPTCVSPQAIGQVPFEPCPQKLPSLGPQGGS